MAFPPYMRIAVNQIRGVCDLTHNSEGQVILVDGIEKEFLQLLTQILKFRYVLTVPRDKQWGSKLPDGNWTGMIGLVHRKEADMAMCSISMSEDRRSAVYFSYPYEIAQMVFATKQPGLLPKFQAYLYPFSLGVWIAILTLMFTMPLLWKALLTSKMYSIRKLYSDVFITFLDKGANIRAVGLQDYCLLVSWTLLVPFLSRCYTAVLLSFLTLPLQESSVRDMLQLSKEISAGNYRCMAFKGTVIKDILKGSVIDSVRFIGNAIEANEWYVKPSLDDVGKAIASGNTAVVAMRPFFADHFSDGSTISDDYFFIAQLGLVFQKQFCCKKLVERTLSRILAAGLVQKCKNYYQFRARLKFKEYEAEPLKIISPLSIQDLSGAFLLLSLGSCVSFVIFLFEVILKKHKM